MSFPPWAIDAARAAFATRPHPLPSVSLAQTAWESGWFKRITGAYNFGGIKAMAGHPSSEHWTHEGGHVEPQLLAFRDFASPAEYFAAHGDILERAAGCADYRAALATGGPFRAVYLFGGGTSAHPRYATGDAKVYGDGLASIMRSTNATQYDQKGR